MFASKVAKPQAKPSERLPGTVTPRRSTPLVHRLGHDPVEQALFHQRAVGNQAMLRLLRQARNVAEKKAGTRYRQAADPVSLTSKVAQSGSSWDFSKIVISPNDKATRVPPRPQFGATPPPSIIQLKLALGRIDDPLEQEADRLADQALQMPNPGVSPNAAPPQISRKCAECAAEEEQKTQTLQTKPADAASVRREPPPILHEVLRSPGEPLDVATRAFFEPRFGFDFGRVRIHHDTGSAVAARALQARAFTAGDDVFFGPDEYRPGTYEGRRLLCHELTHTLQQQGLDAGPTLAAYPIRRQQATSPTTPAASDPLTAPLTEFDWRGVDLWLAQGVVGASPLTGDSGHNADLIAGEIFCDRLVGTPAFGQGDPLLCVLPDVTAADPRVKIIKGYVLSRGPLINWPAVPTADRLVYVMQRLIDVHHYPVNGAAGIVGNVFAESGAIPSRVEGSAAETPLRSANFAGQKQDFQPEEVQNRSGGATPAVGPQKPGVGLAQWTSGSRRSGLFQQTTPEGRQLGSSVLFNMDAQVDYLVTELEAHAGLNDSLTNAGVSVDTASDNVVFDFEIPASVLDATGRKLPRSDPKVVTEFTTRRALAHKALLAYQAAHPGP